MAHERTRQARYTSNQALFDRLDSRSPEAETETDDRRRHIGDHAAFLCECTRSRCAVRIELWLAEYAAVRAEPHQFIVAPFDDHLLPEVDRVVDKNERYFVVEETGAA